MDTTYLVVESNPWRAVLDSVIPLAGAIIVTALAWRMGRRGLWLAVPWLLVVGFMALFLTMMWMVNRDMLLTPANMFGLLASVIDLSAYHATFFMGLALVIVGVRRGASSDG